MEKLFSLILSLLALFLYMFSLATLIGQIRDDWIRGLYEKILFRYFRMLDVVIEPVAIIWHPIVVTLQNTLLLLRICYQGKLGLLLNAFFREKGLSPKLYVFTLVWVVLTVFGWYGFYKSYALLLVFFLFASIVEFRRSKRQFNQL